MINRENYLDVIEFCAYQKEISQAADSTIVASRGRLKILLIWADIKPFTKAPTIRPAFPIYLENLKNPGGNPLSAEYLTSVLKTCKYFFEWIQRRHPGRYRQISAEWIDSLRPSRARSLQSQVKNPELYTLDEVKKLLQVPTEGLPGLRMKAALALLFMSGMRLGAFMTLPIECVDLESLRIHQLPGKGVHTKNSKAAITSLLKIPELLTAARSWDQLVREKLQPGDYWYATLNSMKEISPDGSKSENRLNLESDFRRDLQLLCEEAGREYHSPHKLRHGFAVFALKKAHNMHQLKAISQNLMHSSVGITDGIYGQLVEDDVHQSITSLVEGGGE